MSDDQQASGQVGKVRFHFIKSPQFRVIHVDGTLGGMTPNGRNIHLALFSERVAIPQQVDNLVDTEGHVGAEVSGSRMGREGVVREIEVDAVMDLPTAKLIHEWLGKQIAVVDALTTRKSAT